MIAPRAMLTRGSVQVEETQRVYESSRAGIYIYICIYEIWERGGEGVFVCASCVSACNRATARIPTSGIVEGGGELVFRRLTELGKQWTFDCSRFSSGFTTVESEFLVSRYLLPVQLLLS